MKAERKPRRISSGRNGQPVAGDIRSLRRRRAREVGLSALPIAAVWRTLCEGSIWGAHANICRVIFMMPPVSRVDADACAKLHMYRKLIISDAKPPTDSIGNPSLCGSTA
jgi:hypothetical protein